MTIAQTKAARRRTINDKRWHKPDLTKSSKREQEKVEKMKARQQRSKGK